MASTIKADTLQSTTSNVFVLNSAGTEYARFDSGGDLGIGTTDMSVSGANAKLAVAGGTLNMDEGQAIAWGGGTSRPGIIGNKTSQYIVVNTNGAERMRIDSSGNVKLSAANTKILNSSGNPILQQTGSVLQVVNGTATSTGSSASTTVVDTGLTATITPTSASSKILVLVSQRFFKTQACSAGGTVYLQRGATNLLTDQRVCLNDTTSVGADQVWNCCYLDSPATTSATIYKTQFGNTNTTGLFYVNLDSNQAQITLLEISA